jgi:hypothetical protein
MDVGRIMMRTPRREEKRREEKREEKSFYLLFNTSAYLWGVPWKTNEEEEKAGATADMSFAATGVKGKLQRKASPVLCSERVAIVSSVRPVPRPRPRPVPGPQSFIIIIIYYY